MFQDADKNNDKFLTKSEIRKYFKKNPAVKERILGSDFQWKDFFTNMDTDGDEKFDVNEFTNYLQARQVFQEADKNNDGFLTKSEIRKYFKKHPAEKDRILGSDFEWHDFFVDMDKNGDKKFDVNEFTNYVSRAYLAQTKKAEAAAASTSNVSDDTAASAATRPDIFSSGKAAGFDAYVAPHLVAMRRYV